MTEPLDRFGRDPPVGCGELAFHQRNLLFEVEATRTILGKPGREVGVTRRDDSLLYEVEHVLDGGVDPCALRAQRLEMGLPLTHGSRAVVEHVGEELVQALGPEQTTLHRIDDGALEHLIADAHARAGAVPRAQPAPAPIIAIPPALAGGDEQALAAFGMTAFGDAGEHRWAGHDPGRGHAAGIACDTRLHLQPFLLGDDHRHGHLLPLFLGALRPLVRVVDSVEVDAAIGAACEDIPQVRDVEATATQRHAMLVQVGDDPLVAHRPLSDADALHPVYLLDDQGLRWLDHQTLLRFGAAHFGDLGGVSEWRNRAVPISGFGVAAHGVARELGRLAGLIFVKFGEDRADEIALGVFTDLLRDRDDPDAGALQLAAVMFEQILVAEEPAEGVDAYLGDPAAGAHGLREHRLETGTIVVGAGQATIRVDGDELNAARGIVRAKPLLLIVETDPAIGLALRRDPDIAERAFSSGIGHRPGLRR